jgi:diacylglycerol kinase (ATP)
MNKFIIGRVKSLKYAAQGIWILATSEHSVIAQLCFALLFICSGFYFNITATEWMIQILAIGLVLGIEGLNTAIEKIADFIHPHHHPAIGRIKDMAAGGVLFAGLAGGITILIIYIPHILK